MRIGVDLGGTNVRAGLVKDGRIVRLLSEPCKADRPEGEVVDQIASLIGKLITPDVARIGIGVPSVVDAARGIVYNVVGIPSARGIPQRPARKTVRCPRICQQRLQLLCFGRQPLRRGERI